MILPRSHSLHTNGVALGVHWLVLLVFVFGTIITSIGGMSSHGLTAFTTALHITPFSADESHEHVHGDEDIGGGSQVADADHPHHGADHSHDNVHAVPAAWRSSAPQLAGWSGRVPPWIEMIQASRLERPPMG